MDKFTVTEAPLFLHSGIVGLTNKQFEGRKTALKAIGKGQYEIISAVCFKVGEEIGFAEPIIKTLRSNLVPSGEYAKKGAESASIEIDIADHKKMESAFKDLIKRLASLESDILVEREALAKNLEESEKLNARIAELEAILKEKVDSPDKADAVKPTAGSKKK